MKIPLVFAEIFQSGDRTRSLLDLVEYQQRFSRRYPALLQKFDLPDDAFNIEIVIKN